LRPILLLLLPLCAAACTVAPGPGTPGTLLLTNQDWPETQVETVVTARADCDPGPGFVAGTSFQLPPGATTIIHAPPGADVCWRRLQEPPWPGWNRAYLAPGRIIDSTL
jgi:hypothetical protein